MQRAGRTIWFVLAGWLVLAAVTACSSSGPPRPQPSQTSPTPAPSSAPASGNPQVLARQVYLGMWHAFVAASRTADYQSASLAHYAAGDALSLLTHGLYQNYRNGIVTRGQPSFHPDVTIASSNGADVQATVVDCADSSHWVDYYKSGKRAPGEAQGRQRINARLQTFDGDWKVTYLVVEKVGTC